MGDIINELTSSLSGRLLLNEPLKNHTTIKIGGPADYLVIPQTVEDILNTIRLSKQYNLPLRVMGRGSNLLIGDRGIRGIVIKISDALDDCLIKGDYVEVGAGHSLIALSSKMSKEGLSGLEFASGIPGTIGGAVFMNAGAHRSELSNIFEKALVIFKDGSMEWFTKEQMKFSYRTSILQKERPGICVLVHLRLKKGEKVHITDQMNQNKEYRRLTQPWGTPNCGSVFRNPLPHFAGQLIEDSGLKGYKIGGAEISTHHSNFIINTGDATAEDVFHLIRFVKETVHEKFGVHLETEVEIIE